MTSKFVMDRSYEEERYEFPVSENFKCAICLSVLKNPKGCRNNQHYFCFGCIGEHLKNSHTCPECMDELTLATLVQPPRVLLNCISELRIKCSYSNRGCLEYVKLGNLQTHVDQCGFAPAKCGNEGCGAEVNECEKVSHETELCKFRKFECYGCGELKKEIQKLRKNEEKSNKNMEEKRREMEVKQREMEVKQREMEVKQRKMDEKQNEMDRKMAEVLDSQSRMKEGVKKVFKESLNKIESIFNASQSDSRPTQNAQASEPDVVRSPRQFSYRINHDIFIMGGCGKDGKPTNSVEKFCSKEGSWVDVAPMLVSRASASSVVFENQVIVSGGEAPNRQSNRNEPTDSVEILNLDQCPLRWVMSNVKLPAPLAGHQTFIYEGKLIVVFKLSVTEKDGRGRNVSKVYFKIYEVLLTPPYPARQLYSFPHLRSGSRAELVKDKLFIFGVNSPRDVKIYDLDKNECRDMPDLLHPFALDRVVTTVQWENDVVLIGSARIEFSDELNTYSTNVIKYNTITGETEMLRPTKHARFSCSSIVTDDLIIAMGGEYPRTNSVECCNFHTNPWQALPVMRESRYCATAVVSPM